MCIACFFIVTDNTCFEKGLTYRAVWVTIIFLIRVNFTIKKITLLIVKIILSRFLSHLSIIFIPIRVLEGRKYYITCIFVLFSWIILLNKNNFLNWIIWLSIIQTQVHLHSPLTAENVFCWPRTTRQKDVSCGTSFLIRSIGLYCRSRTSL